MRLALAVWVTITVTWGGLAGPFDGKTFRGRIAWSADGNHNDEDDWAASPIALAILAAFGVQDKLVHFDYNNILPNTDPAWEKEHELSLRGAIERYRFDPAVFHDCRRDLNRALESIVQAVNASSPEDPLYFVLAGPMEVPYRALQKSDPAKRRFVYAISHSRWNDGFARNYAFPYNKRAVIGTGVRWIQIRDQNQLLASSPWGRAARPEEWTPWLWLRDAEEERLRFLWERMAATRRADCSDAGMAYFLMTGDESPDPAKLRSLLLDHQIPRPTDPRFRVRLEAENFAIFEGFAVDDENRDASHRLNARLSGGVGRLAGRFDEPYTARRGVYDVAVRYLAPEGGCQLQFGVGARGSASSWQAPAAPGWQLHWLAGMTVSQQDEVVLRARCTEGRALQIDYVEFVLKSQ